MWLRYVWQLCCTPCSSPYLCDPTPTRSLPHAVCSRWSCDAACAQLLSADCPLPPRVSAALFSLLYRQSIPLLLDPQQQQRLLFSAFRTEQEQRWCGAARQAGGTLWALSPRVLHSYLADQWKLWQRKADTRDQWAIFRLLACCL